MPRVIDNPNQFIVLGENIHTTRIVKRGGVRGHVFDDGTEAVKYRVDGERHYVRVPEHFTTTQPYEQGNLKHFMIAVWKGQHGDADESAEGCSYIQYEVNRQIRGGAHYLDLNVDEASYRLEEQKEAMAWLVKFVESVSSVPPSIDSSNPEIIEVGLQAYGGTQGRPMLNSIALERPDTIDLTLKYNARAVVSAASESGMPADAAERSENIGNILEIAFTKGMPREDAFVDPLVFPIAVDSNYGKHFFDAIEQTRADFGGDVHITGGMSNISFGIPKRRLINDAFVHLAIEAGADSGIIDPNTTSAERSMNLDLESGPMKLAMELLRGNDEYAMNYITAFRAGELD
ncbi:MAG: dihydropteroate synthase [Dehalococcoidia bacterium]|jgi:5-methyltetrahydrofolate--homocysteine methyltransferase|nr:dihydropteroate synthase [Dehalococcoidia bacterium]